jgi:hypothetical protein
MADPFADISAASKGATSDPFADIGSAAKEPKRQVRDKNPFYPEFLPSPETIKQFGKEISTPQGAIKMVRPAAEAVGTGLGAALGGAAGTIFAPGVGTTVGGVGGAGLGYGITSQALNRLEESLGLRAPKAPSEVAKEAAKDVLTGAAFETYGRGVIQPLVEKGARAVARGAGAISDLGQLGTIRAGKIARESLGQDIGRARQTLSAAADDITAGQALADLNLPVTQALLQRAAARDPKFFTTLLGEQEATRLKTLQQLAGGADQTAARGAREELKKLLNERLIPTLEREIGAANIAGKLQPKFAAEAQRMGQAAADKVQDVRRFTAAADRARGTQVFPVEGQPRAPQRYTYMGELAQRADDLANQAAEASLAFGQASNLAKAAESSLAAHNLKPLKSETIVQAIEKKLADPRIAPGNVDLQTALKQIAREFKAWTDNNGVIDGWAVENIRKNSVNGIVRRLYPNADVSTQKRVAANIVEQVRPITVDAIEEAGGTGYRQYLKDYSLGMQAIGQTKLGSDAMKLYLNEPKTFVELVEGNRPELVEKVFGPNSYNIFKELSADIQQKLGRVATEVKRGEAIKTQATAGEDRLVELFKENAPNFRIPNWFTVWVTTTNKLLGAFENKLGKDTLNVLTEGAKSAQNFERLINSLPAVERGKVLSTLNDPTFWAQFRTTAGATAAGMQEARKKNQPSTQPSQMGGVTAMPSPF